MTTNGTLATGPPPYLLPPFIGGAGVAMLPPQKNSRVEVVYWEKPCYYGTFGQGHVNVWHAIRSIPPNTAAIERPTAATALAWRVALMTDQQLSTQTHLLL